MPIPRLIPLLIVALLAGSLTPLALAQSADEVREATKVMHGLAVVLGSTDGQLEAGLAEDGKMLIQGLTTDEDDCLAARKHLFAQGVYGQAAVDHVKSLKQLPFYDRLVNLIVADLDALGGSAPATDEIMRVLGYDGVAYLKRDGQWTRHVRPMPSDVAEFTHYHYDATRSNFSPDERVGPPNALRWVGKPSDHNGYLATRVGHGTTFIRSGTGKGNKSPVEIDKRTPMIIVAKDAHSGVTKWAKNQTKYRGWDRGMEWGVVGDEHLFVYTRGTQSERWGDETFAMVAIEAWDIETGKTNHRWVLGDAHRGSEEIKQRFEDYFPHDAIMAAASGKLAYNFGPELVVREERTGKELWTKDFSREGGWVSRIMVADGLLIAVVLDREGHQGARFGMARGPRPFQSLIAWSLEDGKQAWRFDGEALWEGSHFKFGGTPSVYELTGYRDGVLPMVVWDVTPGKKDVASRGTVTLIDVSTGRRLWSTGTENIKARMAGSRINDHYIANGQVHIARLTAIMASFDLATGAETTDTAWDRSPRSSNCSSGTATTNYLVMQRNYIPWEAVARFAETGGQGGNPDLYYTRLVSFACKGKITPAYGSTFMPEGSCNCTAFTSGSLALYGIREVTPVGDMQRRSRSYPGTVSRSLPRQQKALDSAVSFDWKLRPGRQAMTWGGPRQGPRGTGSTELYGYGKQETPQIKVGDLTIKGYVNEHRVEATRDGEAVWNFIAGGRIGYREPIQFDDERIYFASHDGYIYAVNHADGTLAWRTLAAPADKRMVAFGQLESAWPLFNVYLHEGKVYACAGRHQELDGGLSFCAVDANSGAIDWRMQRRFGLADAEHEGAIHGAHQGRSSRWTDPLQEQLYSSSWANNGRLVIRDDKLVLIPEATRPLTMDIKRPRDVLINQHTFTPPEAEERPAD